jgi:hypothetical protein
VVCAAIDRCGLVSGCKIDAEQTETWNRDSVVMWCDVCGVRPVW